MAIAPARSDACRRDPVARQGPRPAAGGGRAVFALAFAQHRPAAGRHGRLAGRRPSCRRPSLRRRRPSPRGDGQPGRAPTSSTATAWCSRPTCACRASTPTRPGSPTRPRPRGSSRRSCPASMPASCSGGSRPARRFAWVKHRITPEEQQAVLELGLPGRRVQRGRASRLSRRSNLASHVTGFVDIDGDRPGRHRALLDDAAARGRRAGGAEPRSARPADRARGAAATPIAASARSAPTPWCSTVVTGELLAMVSLPDFDPNRVGDVATGSSISTATPARSTSWARCSRS